MFSVVCDGFAFLAGMFDSFVAVCLIVASVCLLWTCGMHGDDLVAVFVRPFWMYMSLCNFSAWANGSALPYVTSESFYQWFIWIGGTGATLGLVLDYLLFSKDKLFGKQTFKGGIFNINEEVIFGLPIVNNKKMVVPFVAAPLIVSIISYFAIAKGDGQCPGWHYAMGVTCTTWCFLFLSDGLSGIVTGGVEYCCYNGGLSAILEKIEVIM